MRRMVPALICLSLLYAFLALVALPQKAFFSSDEGLKFIQVQNILRKGWSDLTLQYPGRDVDPDLNYVPINNPPPLIREGHVYAVYPVAFPTLTAPLFSMFGYAGLYLIPIASGLLTIAVTGRLARIANLEPLAPAILLGLGTPLLFYSLLFWDHTLGALLSTLGLLLVAEHLRAPRTWLLFAGGLLVGSSVWIRTELYAMAVVVLVVYFVVGARRLRGTLFLCLGTLLAVLPLWLFQYFTYGSFLGPHLGHLASVSSSLPISSNRLAIFYYLLLESNSDPRFAFLFLVSFAAAATVVASRRFRRVAWLVV
ncbi:MAG TPA: hypothetical protein ENO24_00370, partial [Chloroflexi bacterium]|nr:hypothetical protein [Chloroflexota bacterium]